MKENVADTLKSISARIDELTEKLAEKKENKSGIITGVTNAIYNGIEKEFYKFKQKLFFISIGIALIVTGFFLAIWGIATFIDTYFVMKGFGYFLIGILASLIGALVYKK